MTIREFCKYLNITTPTLYNWKKEKPNLYEIVTNYKNRERNNINNLDKSEEELLKLFKQLKEDEKKYYISDIRTRILKNKIDKT